MFLLSRKYYVQPSGHGGELDLASSLGILSCLLMDPTTGILEQDNFQWQLLQGEDATTLLEDFDGFLPEFWDRFDHSHLEIRKSVLSFYEDYVLIIVKQTTDPMRMAAALYAPGDVRPLGLGYAPVAEVNRLAPLRLDENTAGDYALFWMWFAARGIAVPLAPLEIKSAPSYFEVSGSAECDGTPATFRLQIDRAGKVTAGAEFSQPLDSKLPYVQPALEPLLRVRSALGVRRWLKPDSEELRGVLKSIDAWGELEGVIHLVRRAEGLAFYEPYRLYELLQRDPEHGFRRSHILCDRTTSKLKLLDGTSPNIHEINNELGESRSGAVFANEKEAEEYLRFFCWAVWGADGPFCNIRRFREVAWTEAPEGAKQVAAEINDPSHWGYNGFENNYYSFRSLLCYSNAIFKTEFRLDVSGMLEMLSDSPLLPALPIMRATEAEGPRIGRIDAVDVPEQRYRQCRFRGLPAESRLTWRDVTGLQACQIIRDFDAFLPEFYDYFNHDDLEVRVAKLSFYRHYELTLVRERSGRRSAVLALYTPGDVRPLDGTSASTEAVNQIESVNLNEAVAADYLWFQLAFCRHAPDPCLPFEVSSDSGKYLRIEARDRIQPFQVEVVSTANGYEFQVECAALSEGTLRAFRARLTPNGAVRFDTERPSIAEVTIEHQIAAALPTAMPLVRIRPLSASVEWERPGDADKEKLDDSLRENAVVVENELIIRAAKGLTWLQPFRLYQVLERNESGGFRRAYVAFDSERGDLRGIVGAATNFDAIVAKARSNRADCWLRDRATAEEFLDFWCWAQQHDAFPIRVLPDREGTQEPANQEDSPLAPPFRFQKIVQHGQGHYRIDFTVEEDGKVNVTRRAPHPEPHSVEPLPSYTGLLFEDRCFPTGEIRRNGPGVYHDAACGDLLAVRDPFNARALRELLVRRSGEANTPVFELADKWIDGQFQFPNMPGWRLVFRNVEFKGRVDLRSVQGICGLEFYNCKFREDLNASGVHVDRNLIFYRCVFGDKERLVEARFDGARIGGDWILRRCLVTKGLFASDMRVSGNALLGGLRVQANVKPFSERLLEQSSTWDSVSIRWYCDRFKKRTGRAILVSTALQMKSTHIEGRLELGALLEEATKDVANWTYWPRIALLAGSVLCDSLSVRGSSTWGGLVVLGELNLMSATFGGNLLAVNQSFKSTSERNELGIQWRFPVKDLRTRLIVRDGMTLHGARLDSSFDPGAAYIGAGLNLTLASIKGGFFSRSAQPESPTSIGDVLRLQIGAGADRYSLVLSAAQCETIEIDGAVFTGGIVANTGTFGRLFIDSLAAIITEAGKANNPVLQLLPTKLESITLSSVTIRGSVRLEAIQVNAIGSSPGYYARPEGTGSLVIQQCEIGGDLIVGADGAYARAYQSLGHFGAKVSSRAFEVNHAAEDARYQSYIPGEIDLRGTTLGGSLNLTHVAVGERIRLSDMTIQGDVRLSRYAASPWPRETKDHPYFRTSCTALQLELTQCEGDLDLTGLEVREPTREEERKQRRHAWKGNPDVEARGLRVGGNLLLSPADGENRSAIGRGASIAGVLRMPSGSCAQLVFSGQNFTSGATVQPRIDLERSVFRRFELLYPLPESIDLSNVRVDRWDIAGEGLENDPHIELLGRTVPFRTGAYAEVERALREQGNTDLADQVYVSMRRAATGEKLKRLRTETNAMGGSLRSTVLRLSRLRRFLSCITDASNDFFIGYGTKPYRLIAIVIFLTIPSLLVFSNPRNVVASMEVVDANASIQFADPLNVHPHQVGYKWSAWDASIMTVRYHVPIVGNALSPRFEPTREPVTLPGWMYVSWSPLPAVPGHFWASAMTWTNWLLWTLLLIVVARNIRVRMAGGG